MTTSIHIAQTNVQLYRQLIEGGYSRSDLMRVHEAYELATELFSGQYRGCGKTLIAHLVGVAGIQASLGLPVEQIQAGLLHSAYLFGDFGSLPGGYHETKRQRLIAVVGEEVAGIIHAFHDLEWEEQDIRRTAETDPSDFNELERALILMRLAHELDEHSDWTFLFTNKYDKPEVLRRLSLITTIAERMDCMPLAGHARQLAEDVQQADPGLDTGSDKPGVYSVVPESYRLRHTALRLYQMLRNYALQWTGRAPRYQKAAD
jgi:hypothetical protein